MSDVPRPVRVGVQIAQYGADWPAFLDAAREVEAVGADPVADTARRVDHVAGGRMILGLGSGFKERDYAEYGIPSGSVASRVTDLERGVPRIRRRLAMLNPPPVRPIPLLIAGAGERRTLRLVARHADIWHTFADGEALARKCRVLDRHCAEIGRPTGEIERSVLVGGDPEESGPALLGLGITLFIVSVRDLDLEPVRRWVRWRDAHRGQASPASPRHAVPLESDARRA